MLLFGDTTIIEAHQVFKGGFPWQQKRTCPYHRMKYFVRFYYLHLSQEATESRSDDTALPSGLCSHSLSLESSNTSWSYQTAPADALNTSSVPYLQDEYSETLLATQPNTSMTLLTLKGVLKQKVCRYGLNIKAQIDNIIGGFIQRQ